MAKRKASEEGLPYFKFVVSKWITGDITECTLSSQGLFTNLCTLYWSKSGVLSYSSMKKKFPRKQKHFDELLAAGILKLNEDYFIISFLDEQLEEFGIVSQKNRENAIARWRKAKQDATAYDLHCESDATAMPVEESREEEIREEERVPPAVVDLGGEEEEPKGVITNEIFSDERFIGELSKNFPSIDLQRAWQGCWLYHSQKPSPPEHGWQWRQKLSTWLEIELRNEKKKQPNGKSFSKNDRTDFNSTEFDIILKHGGGAQ